MSYSKLLHPNSPVFAAGAALAGDFLVIFFLVGVNFQTEIAKIGQIYTMADTPRVQTAYDPNVYSISIHNGLVCGCHQPKPDAARQCQGRWENKAALLKFYTGFYL